MKLETWVIITKLLCVIGIGLATTLGSNLAQWANSDEGPSPIMWVVIIAACIANAGKDVISFLSQSFGDYKIQMRSDGSGKAGIMKPVEPLTGAGKSPIAPIQGPSKVAP